MRYAIRTRDLTGDIWFVCPPDDSWYLQPHPENMPHLFIGYLPYYFTDEVRDSISHELLSAHIDFIVESSDEDRFSDLELLVNGVF